MRSTFPSSSCARAPSIWSLCCRPKQTLFQADDTLAQVQLNRLLACVSLFQALGGGWSPEEKVALAATPPKH